VSYAIRIFMEQPFSEALYRDFIAEAQNLYGKWQVAEASPFHDAGWTIHECKLTSGDTLPNDEWVGVWVAACRHLRDEKPMWPFDYEWCTDFETGTGRTYLGLAVQLGALLLAMRNFPWSIVEDRDSGFEDDYPTLFRSEGAVLKHVARKLGQFPEACDWLQRRGVLDENGCLRLLP